MNAHTTFYIFGPSASLKRMADKLFGDIEPKFLYTYTCINGNSKVKVAVYEQYEKQINSSVTLTCIFESNPQNNKILLKKTGGRMGFRGSSLSEEQSIEAKVIDFILDYSKRFGLTVQEEQVSDVKSDEDL